MKIAEILTPRRVLCLTHQTSKKSVLEYISQLIATDMSLTSEQQLFDAFVAREHLGSTALGHGVALPHIRTPYLSAPIAAFIKLKQGVDFGSEDRRSVDLIFSLVVPEKQENAHLSILADISRQFVQAPFRKSLREHDRSNELFNLLISNSHEPEPI